MLSKKNGAGCSDTLAPSKTLTREYFTVPAEKLLSRLSGVRQSGPGVWAASCPTAAHRHGDLSRGLRIRETEDGRLLIWCGVGCGADDVVAAVGLGLSDLFPPRPDGEHYAKPKAPAIPWRDVLSALGLDLIACSLAFNDLAAGKPFSPEDATYIAQRADDLAAIIREVHHAR